MARTLLLPLLLLAPGLSQGMLAQSNVDGPSLGVVWDQGQNAARVLRGIPGASVQGDGFEAPVKARAGAAIAGISVIAGEDGKVYLWDSRLGAAWRPIAVPDGASALALNEAGTAAAVVYPNGSARIISGLGAETASIRETRLEAPENPVALNADGSLMLEASGVNLWVTNAAGNRWKLAFEQTVNQVAMVNSTDAAVAAADGVWLVRGAGGDGARTQLSNQPARAVAALRNGRTVLAAIEDGAKISVIDTATSEAVSLEAPVAVDRIVRLGAGDVFQLTAHSKDTALWIIDCSQSAPRFLFVPAADATDSEGKKLTKSE